MEEKEWQRTRLRFVCSLRTPGVKKEARVGSDEMSDSVAVDVYFDYL